MKTLPVCQQSINLWSNTSCWVTADPYEYHCFLNGFSLQSLNVKLLMYVYRLIFWFTQTMRNKLYSANNHISIKLALFSIFNLFIFNAKISLFVSIISRRPRDCSIILCCFGNLTNRLDAPIRSKVSVLIWTMKTDQLGVRDYFFLFLLLYAHDQITLLTEKIA